MGIRARPREFVGKELPRRRSTDIKTPVPVKWFENQVRRKLPSLPRHMVEKLISLRRSLHLNSHEVNIALVAELAGASYSLPPVERMHAIRLMKRLIDDAANMHSQAKRQFRRKNP